MADHRDGLGEEGEMTGGVEEDPPIYRSGRVRIIGAEPAGHAASEQEAPAPSDDVELPHWNDAPTGQVPAILDRGHGEEAGLAPPIWREDDTDWAAHEELFEPSMLSDEDAEPAPAGADQVDMDRQPWHFDPALLPNDDETLIIEAEEPVVVRATSATPPVVTPPAVRVESTVAAAPPSPPRARAPRTTRLSEDSPNGRAAGGGGTGGRDMRLAWGSGLALGIVALICAHFGSVSSLVILTAVLLFATAEGFAAFRRAQYHPATLLGLVAVLSLLIETYNKGVSALPLVVAMLVAATFIWFLARVEPAADPVAGLSSTIFVFTWIGGLGSFGALLLNPTLFPQRHGVAFLLGAVITTVAADVASLLVGSAFGRHPLAPTVSPNKSWEGLLGGAVAAVLVAVIVVHFIHPWTVGKALVLGLVVAVVAPLGDLSQSMIKRHLGVKDMGRLMPGHGGILDRVDGLLFVLPATYFVVKAFHLG